MSGTLRSVSYNKWKFTTLFLESVCCRSATITIANSSMLDSISYFFFFSLFFFCYSDLLTVVIHIRSLVYSYFTQQVETDMYHPKTNRWQIFLTNEMRKIGSNPVYFIFWFILCIFLVSFTIDTFINQKKLYTQEKYET